MPNPDSGNLKSDLANRPPAAKRKAPAEGAQVNERTAPWPGLPGKAQPRNRSAGVPRVKAHPKSEGL